MTLGILGGMSWSSTLEYYRLLNQGIHAVRGKQHSADVMIASVDFQQIIDLQVKNHWNEAGALLSLKARGLQRSGAGALMIASNTMHRVLDHVTASSDLPILNIFDGVATALRDAGIQKAGLLGTRYTMSDPFFKTQYQTRDIAIITPETDDAKKINEIIFRELIHGTVMDRSRFQLNEMSMRLLDRGAEAIVLGCTELPLLTKNELQNPQLPFFDTTHIHVEMGLKWLLNQPN